MGGVFASLVSFGTDFGSLDLLDSSHGFGGFAFIGQIPNPGDTAAELLRASMQRSGASEEEQDKAVAEYKEKAKNDPVFQTLTNVAGGMNGLMSAAVTIAIIVGAILVAAIALPALFTLVGGVNSFATRDW